MNCHHTRAKESHKKLTASLPVNNDGHSTTVEVYKCTIKMRDTKKPIQSTTTFYTKKVNENP